MPRHGLIVGDEHGPAPDQLVAGNGRRARPGLSRLRAPRSTSIELRIAAQQAKSSWSAGAGRSTIAFIVYMKGSGSSKRCSSTS